LEATQAGAVTAGPASGSALVTHNFQAGNAVGANTVVRANAVSGANTLSAFTLGLADNRAGGTVFDNAGAAALISWTPGVVKRFISTTSSTLSSPVTAMTGYVNQGEISAAGAWTLGPSSGGVTHQQYGGWRIDWTNKATLANALNVANKSVVQIPNADVGDIDYFTGGVAGQVIYVQGSRGASAARFTHNTGATGQLFLLPGSGSLTLSNYSSAIMVCDGTNWFVLSHTN